MKDVLEALEEIYLNEIPYIEDIEKIYPFSIIEYILDLRMAEYFDDNDNGPRIKITSKGINILQDYEIID